MKIVGVLLLLSCVSIIPAYAEIPGWVKTTAGWWANDLISDETFTTAIEWLVQNNIIQVSDANVLKPVQTSTVSEIPIAPEIAAPIPFTPEITAPTPEVEKPLQFTAEYTVITTSNTIPEFHDVIIIVSSDTSTD